MNDIIQFANEKVPWHSVSVKALRKIKGPSMAVSTEGPGKSSHLFSINPNAPLGRLISPFSLVL